MDQIIADFYKIAQRVHSFGPKFRRHGDLSNMEFFLLLAISKLLRCKEHTECAKVWETSKEDCVRDGITLRELADPMDMSMSAASKKISILEKKGLIKRENSTKDRRNVHIQLTEAGKELCQKEEEKKRLWGMEMIRRFGEEDSRELILLLNKLFDIMEELEQEENREE